MAPPRLNELNAPGRLIRTLHAYLGLFVGLGVLALMCLMWTLITPLLAALLPRPVSRTIGRWTISRAFRAHLGLLTLIGAVRIDLKALDELSGQALILAPNHPGLLDAVLILSRLPRLACVVKQELLWNPWLGAGARLAGYIGNASRHGMIRAAVAELKSGTPLLLFPEGTRTLQPPVNPFRNSLALIAKQAHVPIQTVFIETESRFLGKGWPWLRRPELPIVIHVRLGDRFPPPTRVREATRHLQRYFETELRPACPSASAPTRPAILSLP
jgi:1-acyl-sn-glycerol-3-phosphate acyltransferase